MQMKRIVLIAAALTAMSTALLAQDWAVTSVSANYLRSNPDYEAPLETQTLMGCVLQRGVAEGRWVSVIPQAPAYGPCWVNAMTLAGFDDGQLEQYIGAEKYIVTAEYSRVTDSPVGGNVVCDLVMGDLLRKVFNDKGKAVHTVTHAKVMLPDGRTGYVKYGDLGDFKTWLGLRDPSGADIVATARRFTGVPYLWGGNSIKGVDCSGFSKTVYFLNGYMLLRNASQQYKTGEPVDVSEGLDNLQPADLVFFGREATEDKPVRISHVAIYLGDGKIIHSSQVVRINSLIEGQPDYYARKPIRACRIIGNQDCGKGVVSIAKSGVYFNE